MAVYLKKLFLRYMVVQDTDWIFAKVDEAKALISDGMKDQAIGILDAVKTKAEELKAIQTESQRLIEKQQASLQAIGTHKRKRAESFASKSENTNLQTNVRIQPPAFGEKDKIDGKVGRNRDTFKNHEIQENRDRDTSKPKPNHKIAKKDPENDGRSNAHKPRELSTNEILYQRDRSSIIDKDNDEEQSMRYLASKHVHQIPTDFCRTENNLPLATDEQSQLIQRLREIVKKIKTRIWNFERDKLELLRNAEKEREISEREIKLACRRYVMDVLGLFQHMDTNGNDQLREIWAVIRQFETVQQY